MKLNRVFVLLAAFLLITPSEAEFSRKRLRGLNKIIQDMDLVKTPGSAAAIAAAIREVRHPVGCDPDICFVLDGSRQIGENAFKLQLQFVKIVSAIVGVDDGARFLGVQYGRENRVIRKTRGNVDHFLVDIDRTKWQKARRSSIGAGVAWCSRKLLRLRSKIVLFGDGKSSYRRNPNPAAIANVFLRSSPTHAMCALAVGFSHRDLFTDIVGGDPSFVSKVTEWSRVMDILPALVKNICSIGRPIYDR